MSSCAHWRFYLFVEYIRAMRESSFALVQVNIITSRLDTMERSRKKMFGDGSEESESDVCGKNV